MRHWESDPQYAQGFVIPLLIGAVLWQRRQTVPDRPRRLSWGGVALAALGLALHLWAIYYFYETFDVLSLIPCVAACLWCIGGWPLVRWSWPGLVLMLFMVPLPFRVEQLMSMPLRGVACRGTVVLLQILGFPAVAESNVVLVDTVEIGVIEACNGLGMIVTLSALTTTVVFFSDKPWWQKTIVILSALPIALFANILRIASTAVLYEWSGSSTADLFYHDLAGWFMMPVALFLLWLEFLVLAKLLVPVEALADDDMLKLVGLQTKASNTNVSLKA